jgi:DNA invertase Pin-like site-specific DNA recombinase
VATKIDRVSRSVRDFANLVLDAQAGKWALVVLDIGLDLSTPIGKFVAHVLSAAAELERAMIGQRTNDGLAEA